MSSVAVLRKDMRMALTMTKIAVSDKFMGSGLGSLWAVLSPLSVLAIYTFVFGYVLKLKAPGAETTLSYAIWLIAGMGPWIATSEALSAATNSVVSGSSLVKNLAFRTEILPIAAVMTSLITLLVSLVFLGALLIFDGKGLNWHWLMLPAVMLVQYVFLVGIGLAFATVNVFFRDFGVMLGNLLMILLFATPIFYPINQMPETVRKISQFNPFFIVADSYRSILLDDAAPNLFGSVYLLIVAIVTLAIGYFLFRRLKGYFEGFL